jgi:hypothetical protein
MKKFLAATKTTVSTVLLFAGSAMVKCCNACALDAPTYSVQSGNITQTVQRILNSSSSSSNTLDTYEKIGENIGTIILFAIPLVVGLVIWRIRKNKN